MLLAWAVSCESYETRGDGTVDVFGAGFDTFYVDRLPAKLDVTILTRLLLLEDEQAEIELHVLGPSTAPLGTLSYKVEAEPGPDHRSGYLVSQTQPLEVEFVAETEGVYSVEIYTEGRGDAISEERRRSIFFSVRLAAQS